jgi:hypothetical protein
VTAVPVAVWLVVMQCVAAATSGPVPGCPPHTTVGFHPATCDSTGNLLPWTMALDSQMSVADALQAALTLEMEFYQRSPPAGTEPSPVCASPSG